MNVVFLHIPKAGGTTFRNTLAKNFPSGKLCPEQHNHLDRFTLEELASYSLFAGHFDRASCDRIPNPKVFITMLRDPVNRVISTYRFWRSHKMSYLENHPQKFMKIAKTRPLEDFLDSEDLVVRQYIDNGMVRQLASSYPTKDSDPLWENPNNALAKAKAVLSETVGFGFQERYEDSTAFIFGKLGFAPPEKIESANVTSIRAQVDPTMESADMAPVSESSKIKIRTMNALDYNLYKFSENLFFYRYNKWKLKNSLYI